MEVRTGFVPLGERGRVPYFRFGGGERHFVILPGVSAEPVWRTAPAVAARYASFAETYTVTLLDRTEPLREDVTVDDMADDAAAAMDALGIADACVFGASQGGMIALRLAARYPRLTARIAVGSSSAELLPETARTFARWTELADAGKIEDLNRVMFGQIYSEAYRRERAAAFEVAVRLGTEAGCRRISRLLRAAVPGDALEALRAIRCPVLAIGAEEDRVIPARGSEEIARLTGGKVHVYPGAAHAVFDEAPDYPERLYRFFGGR